MNKHIHHIIPKHMGGSDHVDNLIELTIEEHATAHLKLWETHGKEEDRIAWLALSGQIGKDEARRLAHLSVMIGHKHNVGRKRSWREIIRQREIWATSPERKKKLAELLRIRNKSSLMREKIRKPKTKLHAENISKAKRGIIPPILQCPHCNKTGKGSVMYRYHFDRCKDV